MKAGQETIVRPEEALKAVHLLETRLDSLYEYLFGTEGNCAAPYALRDVGGKQRGIGACDANNKICANIVTRCNFLETKIANMHNKLVSFLACEPCSNPVKWEPKPDSAEDMLKARGDSPLTLKDIEAAAKAEAEKEITRYRDLLASCNSLSTYCGPTK